MDLKLFNKPVIVMASSSGIGLGVAMEFAREDAKVMLFGRSKDRLEKAKKQIYQETANHVEYTIGDITNKKDIELVVQNTIDAFGSVYALFNNTGGPQAAKFDNLNDNDWVEAFELTLLSYIRTIRTVLPIMRKAGTGRIVNNTSISIKQAIDNLILSNTFRTGIVGLTKTLSSELAEDNILINVVGAGKTATNRVDYLDSVRAENENSSLQDVQRQSAKTIPLGRYGKTEEIAKLVVFLCSNANTYITGQSILVDGGIVKAY